MIRRTTFWGGGDHLPVGSALVKKLTLPGHIQSVWSPLTHLCFLSQSDGVQQTNYLAQRYCQEAIRQISRLRPSPERDALIRLTEMVLTRDKWTSSARLHFRQLPAERYFTTMCLRNLGSRQRLWEKQCELGSYRPLVPFVVPTLNEYGSKLVCENTIRIMESKWHRVLFLYWYLLLDDGFKIQDELLLYMNTLSF